MSGDVDVANLAGRRKGTSAPYRFATSAIFVLSVEQTARSNTPAWRAVATAYARRGCPASGRTFLSRTRSDPARAGISATALGTRPQLRRAGARASAPRRRAAG